MFAISRAVRRCTYQGHTLGFTLFKKQFPQVVQKLNGTGRNIHLSRHVCAKMFTEYENKYAYDLMESKGYAKKLDITKLSTGETLLSEEQFNQLLSEDWTSKSPEKLYEAFSLFGTYCSAHKLCISNKMFDNFIDCLTDSLSRATETELESVFYSLEKWPETESVRTRNFIEVWAALDDECLRRMKEWSSDKMLHFVSLFYLLNVTRSSDYSNKALNKLASKARQLTPGQLVQTMFFIGVLRRPPFDMHSLEIQLKNHFAELNVDDLSITSMGFFKSKTPIRDLNLVLKIVNKVIENSQSINEVSLAALLKVIRYSMKTCVDDRINRLLDALQHEVPRLSLMCNVHIALLGTATLTFHEGCLTRISEKLSSIVSDARIKDLERLWLTYGVFNFVPKSQEGLFERMFDELRRPERESELKKHGRSFVLCLAYAGLLGLYPVDLISKALSPEFLEQTYGKPYAFGREVLTLHNSAQIFCADAKMNRLPDRTVRILAKKYTDYVPSEQYKKQYNVSEKMFLDVFKVMKEDRGNEYVIGEHILPHHQRGDIIVCNSREGSALPVDAFETSNFGFIRKPPDSNIWIVLVIAGRNAIIRDSNNPTGPFYAKVRELKALGYYPALVPYYTYSGLSTASEKTEYLNNLIKHAINDPK